MRQNPNQQIPLDRLILEAKEEWKRKQERATLQLHLNTTARIPSQRKELCAYCRLPNHKEDTCYYKHVHLRKPGWQPNSITMQKIQERLRGAVNLQSSNHSSTSAGSPQLDLFNFVQYSHQAHFESTSEITKDSWIADSGANHHFCNSKSHLQNYIDDPLTINTGTGSVISPGHGDINLQLQ
ncbi:unnamed protein product [Calypogeia fissa]